MFKTAHIAALLVATSLPAPGAAGSEWTDLADVADVSILPGWRQQDGTHVAALSIVLKPGWKTYWRAPGEAGIPPEFEWLGSENLAGVSFHWPVPKVFEQNGMQAIGYDGTLILPLQATPRVAGEHIELRATVNLGVCEDVCLPLSVAVSGDLPASGGTQDPQIVQALGSHPQTASEAGVRSVVCKVEPISDGLRLTATVDMPAIGADEVAVVEVADPTVWVAETDSARKGSMLVAQTDLVPASGSPFLLDRSDIRMTILSHGHAVDIRGCTGG